MSNKYAYDSTGLPTAYLTLTLLTPLIIFLIYSDIKTYLSKRRPCKCATCSELKSSNSKYSRFSLSFRAKFLLFILLPLSSYLVHLILTVKEESESSFDPYVVLDVDISSSKKDIKRAFRRLVKKNNPDKFGISPDEKESITKFLFDVSKAYSLLMDGDKMDAYVKDKRNIKEMYAMPQFVFSYFSKKKDDDDDSDTNKTYSALAVVIWIFGFYAVCIIFILPWYAFKAWKKTTNINSTGIDYKTSGMFYQKMKNIKGERWFIDLVCESVEAKKTKWALNKWAILEIEKNCVSKEVAKNFSSIKEQISPDLNTKNKVNEIKDNIGELKDNIDDKIKGNDEIKNKVDNKKNKTGSNDEIRDTIGNKKNKIDGTKKNKTGSNDEIRDTIDNKKNKIDGNKENKIDGNKKNKVGSINRIKNKKIEDKKELNIIYNKKEIPNKKEKRACRFVKHHIENHFGYPLKADQPIGYYILMDHLFRTQIFTTETRKEMITSVLGMIETCKKIAIASENSTLFFESFTYEKMIYQAVFDPQMWMMQIPGTKFYDLLQAKKIKQELFETPIIEISKIEAYIDSEENDELVSVENEIKNENETKDNNKKEVGNIITKDKIDDKDTENNKKEVGNIKDKTDDKDTEIDKKEVSSIKTKDKINDKDTESNIKEVSSIKTKDKIDDKDTESNIKEVSNIKTKDKIDDRNTEMNKIEISNLKTNEDGIFYNPLSKFNSQAEYKLPKESIITLKITLKRPGKTIEKNEQAYFIKTKGEKDIAVLNSISGKSIKTYIHSPHLTILNLEKKETELLKWEIVAEEDGILLIKNHFIIADFCGEKEIYMKMEGKQKSGESSNIKISLCCGAYFGCDVGAGITIKYF